MSDKHKSSVCATNSQFLAAVLDRIIFIKSKQTFHDHIQSKIYGIKSDRELINETAMIDQRFSILLTSHAIILATFQSFPAVLVCFIYLHTFFYILNQESNSF